MRPAARVQAAIEVLDEIIAAAREGGAAADMIMARFFEKRRYAGSGDRRAIRELAYRAIRRTGERPVSGRAAMLGVGQDDPSILELFDWSLRGPIPPVPGEPVCDALPLAGWIAEALDPLIAAEEIPALLDRAPLDLRVNPLKAEMAEILAALPEAERLDRTPSGLRVPEGTRIDALWKEGRIEVQDEGSQMIALACAARPGQIVVDLCAGAGGKTLALAADMANQGALVACDTDRGRLSRLAPRAERAGVTIASAHLLNPMKERDQLAQLRGRADVVLVDAPCSGSGTWRRNPETRWRLTEDRLERVVALQARLLDIAVELVKPGGQLVYAVCSILAAEGRQQAERFSGSHSAPVTEQDFMEAGRPAGPGRLLTPGHDGTDGFFVARWRVP